MLYRGSCHVSSHLVLVIRLCMVRNNPGTPGPAGAYDAIYEEHRSDWLQEHSGAATTQ